MDPCFPERLMAQKIEGQQMTRDPARIDTLLALLRTYWQKYPDLRLGQIIDNFSDHVPVWVIEDDALIKCLKVALDDKKPQ